MRSLPGDIVRLCFRTSGCGRVCFLRSDAPACRGVIVRAAAGDLWSANGAGGTLGFAK
jgi:hypothetical protein